jgi:hypothetical protein
MKAYRKWITALALGLVVIIRVIDLNETIYAFHPQKDKSSGVLFVHEIAITNYPKYAKKISNHIFGESVNGRLAESVLFEIIVSREFYRHLWRDNDTSGLRIFVEAFVPRRARQNRINRNIDKHLRYECGSSPIIFNDNDRRYTIQPILKISRETSAFGDALHMKRWKFDADCGFRIQSGSIGGISHGISRASRLRNRLLHIGGLADGDLIHFQDGLTQPTSLNVENDSLEGADDHKKSRKPNIHQSAAVLFSRSSASWAASASVFGAGRNWKTNGQFWGWLRSPSDSWGLPWAMGFGGPSACRRLGAGFCRASVSAAGARPPTVIDNAMTAATSLSWMVYRPPRYRSVRCTEWHPIATKHCTKNTAVKLPRAILLAIFRSLSLIPKA